MVDVSGGSGAGGGVGTTLEGGGGGGGGTSAQISSTGAGASADAGASAGVSAGAGAGVEASAVAGTSISKPRFGVFNHCASCETLVEVGFICEMCNPDADAANEKLRSDAVKVASQIRSEFRAKREAKTLTTTRKSSVQTSLGSLLETPQVCQGFVGFTRECGSVFNVYSYRRWHL